MKKFPRTLAALACTLALFTTALLPAGLAAGKTFTDVPNSYWAAEQIAQAVEQGITNGYDDGSFKPDNSVTYAHYYTFIARAFFPEETAKNVAEVKTGPWYTPYFLAIFHSRAAKGTAAYDDWNNSGEYNDIFNSSISRYDMALVMYNILGCKGGTMPSSDDAVAASAKMSDWGSVPEKYHTAVSTCYALGLLNGKGGKFDGQSNMTRAQACVVISRLKDYLKDNSTGTPATSTQPSETTPTTPVTPSEPVTQPTGDTTFAMLNGENVQQMMTRINTATPPYREGYLANGQPITEENIKAAIEEIKESMPEGSPWGTGEFYKYYFGIHAAKWGYTGGGGCASYAWGVSDTIFGEDAPVIQHQNYEVLKIGDAIWMKESEDDVGHIYFVTTNQNEDGYVLTTDGNVPSASGERTVHYGTTLRPERLTPDNSYTKYSIIYSRY